MRYASIAGYLLLIGALGGCALGRDVVTVKAPEASTVTASNGKSVRIESVLDGRKFEAAPSQADIPSLDPDADNGPDAKSRAIARKRGGFGKALGDVALAEGQSVSGLVEQAISTGFKESGYTVVKKGDANYESATPVSATINQFWAWFSPGAWSVKVSQKSESHEEYEHTSNERMPTGRGPRHGYRAAARIQPRPDLLAAGRQRIHVAAPQSG